jgi:hypothetical protein
VIAHSADLRSGRGNNMAKRKPFSDTTITPSTPTVLRYLERQHYKSDDWKSDAGIKQRGLGNREVETDADVYQIDTISTDGRN